MKKLTFREDPTSKRRFITNADPAEFRYKTTPVLYNDAVLGTIDKPELEFYLPPAPIPPPNQLELVARVDPEGLIDAVTIKGGYDAAKPPATNTRNRPRSDGTPRA